MFEHVAARGGIDVYLLSQIDGAVENKPIAEQDDLAAIEGWIAVPTCPLADLSSGGDRRS